MKQDFARIAIILDRSGSMETVREATVSGFNEFIREQRKTHGEVQVKLVQFDEIYEEVFDLPLGEVPELNQNTFVPRGSTALFDAQGRTIVTLGQELAAMREEDRPSKVIVVTLTDGEENASRHYTLEAVADLIQQQRDVYHWEFVFLAANQDAIRTAATMNIPMGSALTYNANSTAVRNTMAAASAYVVAARAGGDALFSMKQRDAAMVDEEPAPSPVRAVRKPRARKPPASPAVEPPASC